MAKIDVRAVLFSVGDSVVITKGCGYCSGNITGAVGTIKLVGGTGTSRRSYYLRVPAQLIPARRNVPTTNTDNKPKYRLISKKSSWHACNNCIQLAKVDMALPNKVFIYG
jgi:hypothetical protein